MAYSVAAYFNQSTWEKSGLSWVRKAKSEKLNGFVLGNLSEDTKLKISELGFENISPERLDLCGHCLITKSEVLIRRGLPETFDVYCPIDKTLSPVDIVWSIANLGERVTTIHLLQKIFNVHGGMFSTRYILGSGSFWKKFNSFQNYLLSQNYLDGNVRRDELMLNMYLSFFDSTNVGTDKND